MIQSLSSTNFKLKLKSIIMKTRTPLPHTALSRKAHTLLGTFAAGFSLLSTPAFAELLVYEGFDYDVFSSIEFQNGGIGWNGGWGWRNSFDGKGSVILNGSEVLEGSLAYGDLQTSGNHVKLYGDLGQLELARRMASVIPGTDGTSTYISVLGQRVGPLASTEFKPDGVTSWDNPETEEIETYPYGDNLYPRGASLRFWSDTNGEKLGIGNFSNQQTNEWMVYGSGLLNPSGVSFTEAPAFVVVRIDHKGDETVADSIYMWVNPDLSVGDDISAAQVQLPDVYDINDPEAPVDMSRLSWISPYVGHASGDRPYAELLLDEIRVGTTWNDVTPSGSGNGGGGEEPDTWAGYPILNAEMDVNTEGLMGFVNVEKAPFIWSYGLGTYVYVDEAAISTSGAWLYIYNLSGVEAPGGETTWAGYPIIDGEFVNTGTFMKYLKVNGDPYIYAFGVESWLYMPQNYVSAFGAWAYLLAAF